MSEPAPLLTDAVVADYLRRRAYEINVQLRTTRQEAQDSERGGGRGLTQQILGPRKLREGAAAHARALLAAVGALEAEQTPVRQIKLGPEHERLTTPDIKELCVLAQKVEPQPPSAAESRSQPYGFYQKPRDQGTDEWSVSGSCGFVLKAVGQDQWRCPLGAAGEVVQIDNVWWEVLDVRVERWAGEGYWYWIATYRRAEMADWREAP